MAVVARDPQHTFALDDGTSSFRRAQSDLRQGRLPDPASIRVEHFINAVPDDYPRPQHAAFALYAEAGPHPFSQRTTLVAVGVAGRDARPDERRPLRLVLGLDVSGSMAQRGGWERARHALGGLIDHLRADDRVAVVAFAERARVVLPVVPGSAQDAIQAALDRLDPQGSTNLAEGLALSCQVARELAEPGCALRVALVSDGVALAGADAATANAWLGGLTAVGGNLLLLTVGEQVADLAAHEALATAGDGTLLHLTSDDDDDLRDRLLPERLQLVAQDAKAQVTWNPDRVSHARLVGYEHRRLAHRDFRNDAVAAGAIAAAVTVTALFEVVLVEGGHGPLGTAAVRYHDVRLGQVREQACPLPGTILSRAASPRLRTLACAAELAEQLRGGWWANVRPTPFADISAACRGLPQPADALAGMADTAARLVNVPRIAP
jgi:Ca-activated chloride channel family protein